MWLATDKNSTPLFTYDGEFPDRLYRYRTVRPGNIDRLIDQEVCGEEIYLAGLKDLNDPDEGRFIVKFEGDLASITDFWRQAIKNTRPELEASQIDNMAASYALDVVNSGYAAPDHVVAYTRNALEHLVRVACFTTLPLNYAMWANYAKYVENQDRILDHGGICIEYRCDTSWQALNLHPVEYDDAIPTLNVVKRDERLLTGMIYKKSSEWRCEQEWRVMSTLQTKPPFKANFAANSKVKVENGVAAVIFGLNTPPEIISEFVMRTLRVKPSVAFRRVVKNPLTLVRQIVDLPPLAP